MGITTVEMKNGISESLKVYVSQKLSENMSAELTKYFIGILQPAIAKTSIEISQNFEQIIMQIK